MSEAGQQNKAVMLTGFGGYDKFIAKIQDIPKTSENEVKMKNLVF